MKFEDLLSIRWWGTVGTVLILWTIFSDLIKRGIYAFMGMFFTQWGDRNEAVVRRFNIDVQAALADKSKYDWHVRLENRQRQKAIYCMLVSVFFICFTLLAQLMRSQNWLTHISDWPFPVLREQLGAYLTSLVALGYFILGTINWAKAARNAAIQSNADSIRPHLAVNVKDPDVAG